MTDAEKLHVAMFPWLAFGHIIPFLELAKKIAQKGHTVYFISTPRNIERLPKIPQSLSTSINMVQFPLPHVENLPQNSEATMDLPYQKIPLLKRAHDKLQDSLSSFLETHLPDWIIYDFAPHWLPQIASKLGISRAHFGLFNAATVSFFGPTATDLLDAYGVRSEPEQFTVPPKWVPSTTSSKPVSFRLFEAKKTLEVYKENESEVSDWFRIKSTVEGCHVYLIRSCEEVESKWLNLLPGLIRKPVVPVGLLPPSAEDGALDAVVDRWLTKHEKGSVVYVALGSEIRPSQEDFNELALGLELSGVPFFWALRRGRGPSKAPRWV
ncbi:UDP-glucuronosyl/UDP-glucosyltransferase [Trema orientale]|uniref:UDP-glucuronosyl/UDP-glucosyltransferase n=1 Tax=Trema orientale TaxID=63057 RepID=A0A2P5EGN5_TREOI|nr:UDP-glucuronosyl/UDP-glucosyltransferase [Trema orientale]